MEETGANDLVIALEAADKATGEKIIKRAEDLLSRGISGGTEKDAYRTIDEAVGDTPDANLCLISVPGEHAYDIAVKALEKNLNLLIFSDNVSLAEELKLKQMGREKGLVVMGPDAGVAVINGIALATASVIEKGPIGIVAASGSGAQEISCIIDRLGCGVSQLIATGGRDLSRDIGGITMLKGIEILEKDTETEIMVLVSKMADQHIVEQVLARADKCGKPVVAIFLGARKNIYAGHSVIPSFSLEEAAVKAVSLIRKEQVQFGLSVAEEDRVVEREVSKYSHTQKYLRGLYCGGTFSEEALIILNETSSLGDRICSNLKTSIGNRLNDVRISEKHTLLDMGDEAFTRERPHPVFDPEMRRLRFLEEAEDENVAVIMLDFILGPGVHHNPIGALLSAVREQKEAALKSGRWLTVIASTCGSDKDPQNLYEQQQALLKEGVIVLDSNAQAARVAGKIIAKIEKRS